jgi:hypothetical protein
MSRVVLQAAEFASNEACARAEAEIRSLIEAYASFERSDPDPWSQDRPPPAPLVEFGRRHDVEWPSSKDGRFFLREPIAEAAQVLAVGRMLFFWAPGFALGGPALRRCLQRIGAVAVAGCGGDGDDGRVDLVIRAASATARLEELAEFLDAEDYEDQYEVVDDPEALELALFTITADDGQARSTMVFDDSGVQDWAFVAALPQLDGDEPRLATER